MELKLSYTTETLYQRKKRPRKTFFKDRDRTATDISHSLLTPDNNTTIDEAVQSQKKAAGGSIDGGGGDHKHRSDEFDTKFMFLDTQMNHEGYKNYSKTSRSQNKRRNSLDLDSQLSKTDARTLESVSKEITIPESIESDFLASTLHSIKKDNYPSVKAL